MAEEARHGGDCFVIKKFFKFIRNGEEPSLPCCSHKDYRPSEKAERKFQKAHRKVILL